MITLNNLSPQARANAEQMKKDLTAVYGAITRTEMKVLLGITCGMTNREIADSMVVSTETVKTHCQHLSKKLGDKYPKRKGSRK